MELTIGITLLFSFFILLFLNVPLAISLGLGTMITMFIFNLPMEIYADVVFAGLSPVTLLAIPFFIFAGVLMDKSGASNNIMKFATLIIGSVPGGGGGLAIAGESIGTLFIAGILPGILMGLCFCTYAFIYSLKKGYKGVPYGKFSEIVQAFKDAFWGLLTPVIILGGIYGGVFTPTEAAAVVAVVYSLFLGLVIYKKFTIKDLWRVSAEAGVGSATIMIIIANASVLTWLVNAEGIAVAVSTILLDSVSSMLAMMFIIEIILLISGFFLDAISIQYIFIPLFLPIIVAIGLHPIWFGVVMTMAIAIGFCTPPIAVNLYPACRVAGIGLATISKSIVWLIVAGITAMVIVTVFPEIILFIPRLLGMM